MNYSILHTESSCGWGGQELRVLTEAQGMLARGHRVQLVCPAQSPLYAAAQARAIPATPLPIGDKQLHGVWTLARWLRAHGPFQIINTHSSTDAWLVALARKLIRWEGVVIRTRHVSTPVPRNLTTRWLYQRATDHIVTTGEALRRQLNRDNGFLMERMTSVPTGVDLNRFSPGDPSVARTALGLESTRRYLGIVATLRNWKGHVYLLDSLRQWAEDWMEWDVLIIGDGPQRENLARRVTDLGLETRVRMVGNQDDVPRWLQALDIFVLPSYGCEGVPQSVMQAMACGLPVVSTTVGAIDEAVIHERTGLLIPPRQTEALTAALVRLMSHPDLRVHMGTAGHERAVAEFGMDKMLVAMENVYTRMLQQ